MSDNLRNAFVIGAAGLQLAAGNLFPDNSLAGKIDQLATNTEIVSENRKFAGETIDSINKKPGVEQHPPKP